uniref:Nucleolar complex protein 2 homolog n=1 Tax=Haemonchus placei TaxID=6290 RepID=A0A158QPR3_HAEPC
LQEQTEADGHTSEDGKHLKLKRIKKYQSPLKQYLSSILKVKFDFIFLFQFANEVQSPEVIISTLKAIRRVVCLIYCLNGFCGSHFMRTHFCKIFEVTVISQTIILPRIFPLFNNLTLQCRVAAYVCMMQLVKSHPEHFVSLYKNCYLGFVTNSREVTAETWPLLHFMHRTFAELTVLHPNLAYPYAFVYIRQIAIHLRNAIISKKRKDMVQAVYNWQMMQCLYLWVRVVSKAHAVHDCEAICELAYPLTQLIYGVLKLYHSLRHIPLRLHCISLLIQLQANCGTYVPTLTLATEKPKSLKDAKVVDMECTLKVCVGAPMLDISVWRSALCDHLFRVTLQAAHLICSQPSFPDVIVPITHRIRSVEFARCFRSLLEKLEEHAKFVADILLTKEFSIRDDMSLKLALNDPSSPLRVFYRQWEKTWRLKEGRQASSHSKEAAEEEAEIRKSIYFALQLVEPFLIFTEKVKEKPNKKKRKSTAAADRADETIPDQLLEDLGNWSDSN